MKRFLRFSLIGWLLLMAVVCPARAAERVRVLCDRSLYAAGETIWMRGWITDTDRNVPTSRFLYVELLRDGHGDIEKRIKIKEQGGLFISQLELADDLDSGWYTLRAYTLAQKDWPADALFHTRLLIRGTGPIPSLYAMHSVQAADNEDIEVDLTRDTDGYLTVTLTDVDGHPVAGNFALSVVPGIYADYDYQPSPFTSDPSADLVEGPREYAQEIDFRVKSVNRRLPEKYSVAIMSQDIGYYHAQDIEGYRNLRGEEGQLFRIPDLDFQEGTLFSVNVTGSPNIFPALEQECFAAPFDYGPTWPKQPEIRDTVLIRARLDGTATPLPPDDTITTSLITAERKPSFYRPDRIVGPYSSVFEWRQVQLREQLSPYDDRNLMMHITSFYPGFIISYDSEEFKCNMYTTRGGSVSPKGYSSFHPVDLYIDGIKQDDWTEARTLSVRDVQNLYVLRGSEAALYRASAVVLLELRHFDYKELDAVHRAGHQATIGILPLGWRRPKDFDPEPSSPLDRRGTLYWNPCIRTNAAGRAEIALPELPENCYIRLEGRTLDGRWFSKRLL